MSALALAFFKAIALEVPLIAGDVPCSIEWWGGFVYSLVEYLSVIFCH
jgi:hypothetical protein